MADFSTSIDIEAPPEMVFDHLVNPARMVAWMGQHAELQPNPGGVFAVDIDGVLVRGEYLEVDPPRRVVVSWGMAGAADFAPGSSKVEFNLVPTSNGTQLSLVHRDLPDARTQGHARGWTHYLGRLRVAAGGADPGVDTFVRDMEAGGL